MRYICAECGKVLTEEEAVKDPDGDIECMPCYEGNKDNWFDDDEPEEEEPEEPEPSPQLDYNGRAIKKEPYLQWYWKVIIGIVVALTVLGFCPSVLEWLSSFPW